MPNPLLIPFLSFLVRAKSSSFQFWFFFFRTFLFIIGLQTNAWEPLFRPGFAEQQFFQQNRKLRIFLLFFFVLFIFRQHLPTVDVLCISPSCPIFFFFFDEQVRPPQLFDRQLASPRPPFLNHAQVFEADRSRRGCFL